MPDLNSDLFKQLAGMAFAPVSSPAQKTSDLDIAKSILLNSNVNSSGNWKFNYAALPSDKGKKQGGPSTFSRVIDILQRPEYASTAYLKSFGSELSKGNLYTLDPIKAAWKGLTGEDKALPSKYLKESGMLPDNTVGKFATGLTADILGDPLTYVGPGLVRGAWKGLKELTSTEKTAAVINKAVTDAPAVSTALEQTVKTAGVAEHALSPMQAALVTGDAVKEGRMVLKAGDASNAAVKTYSQTMKDVLYQNRTHPQNVILQNSDAIQFRMLPKGARGAKGRFVPNPKYVARPVPAPNVINSKTSILSTISQHLTNELGAGNHVSLVTPAINKFLTNPNVSLETAMQEIANAVEHTSLKTNSLKFIKDTLKTSMGTTGKKSIYSVNKAGKAVTSFPKVVEATTRALNSVLDEPIRTLKPGETVSEKGVTHGIMSRVATWWGQKDLRPLALDAKTSALAAAEARQVALSNLFKPFNDEQILQAWDVATKIRPKDITHPDVVKLADQLTGSMENWFKSVAIPESAAKGNSVALRSGLTLEDMNTALKRYGVDFQFTAAKDAAVKGGTHTRDFSNGVDWLNSWEGHIPETALALRKAIFGIQSAAEQVTREYGFLDDAASRFGTRTKKPGYVAIKNDRLDGWYFPADMADQMSLALKTYHDMYRPSSDVAKFMASGISAWKAGVTKYNPRHHIANVIGDSFLAWMAGVNNPLVFKKAVQVMAAQRGRYKDIESVEDLVGPNALSNAMSQSGKAITKNKSGVKFTADQIYIATHNYGLLQKVSAIEDLANPGVFQRIKPFGGRVSKPLSAVSESREHVVKIAHFIDIVSKSKGKNITEIFENAAHEVRKWHPDGLDLTKEEQALRTFGIPFYSWLRKSTPLLIEGAVMNPKKAFLIPQHTLYNAQTSIGINPSSPSDLFPADQMFPGWIQESGIGPLGLTGAPGLAGMIGGLGRQGKDEDGNDIGGYTIAGPSNPMQDTFEAFGGFSGEGIMRGLAGSVNPAIRIPAEVAFGQRVFSGVPISDKSDYATEQIPLVSQGARMTNLTPFGTSQRGAKEGVGNMEGIYNWLFNAGIVGTGPYIKSAEFEDIPRQRDQNNAYREFAQQIGSPLNKKGKIPQWIKDLYAQQQGNK